MFVVCLCLFEVCSRGGIDLYQLMILCNMSQSLGPFVYFKLIESNFNEVLVD